MTVKEFKIEDLKPYENNPRYNDTAVEYVANSINEFGFKVPIVVDKNNVIVAGHTRLKAAEKLGLKTVPCIVADDLTPEQVQAFRLADNKTAEIAEWDFDLLARELDELNGVIEMSDFGFNEIEEELEQLDDTYTNTINIPKYEPTQDEPPEVEELTDLDKYNELVAEIQKSNLCKKDKAFLRLAAARHIVFNYKAIAEYYAHANEELQRLMEKSALVIIDYDKAIEYGYCKIKTAIDELRDAIEGEDDEEFQR